MKKGKILVVALILISIMVSIPVVTALRRKPPLKEITEARLKLAEASLQHAPQYASELFQTASMQYDSAINQWKLSNRKFFLVRNFDQVKTHATLSAQLADEALIQTRIQVRQAGEELGARIRSLEKQVATFDMRYGHFPYSKPDMDRFSQARLLLSEATIAFEQAGFPACEVKLGSAESIMANLNQQYEESLNLYFIHYPLWEKWVESTLETSLKNRTVCLVVDKYSRTCLLYRNGLLQDHFDIELGSNWIGDKNQQGDKSTPEGIYRIVEKKSGSGTRYYKAFLLDYPNQDDVARFRANQRNGSIGRDAQIGNSIEIHGHGGKGTDWTDGCVALTDTDMDDLFAICQTGTRVTIIGSAIPMETILSNESESAD